MSPLRIGMIFGGRSVEHEVSVLTAHQAMAAMPKDRYTTVPIYIDKTGQWYTGEALRTLDHFRDVEKLISLAEPVVLNTNSGQRSLLIQRSPKKRGLFGSSSKQPEEQSIDIAFPLMHGTYGEDGTLQGLLEIADIPYVGSDVTASAIAMNKVLTKMIMRQANIAVLDDIAFDRMRWEQAADAIVAEIEQRLGYPVFVKPVHLGSSIGVAAASNAKDLRFAIDVAATYDTHIMVEPHQQAIIEVNCAVLGYGSDVRASVCEQPVTTTTLSYEDKYMHGGKSQGMKGARRIIPAPIADDLTAAIQQTSTRAFQAIGATGVARIDFLVRPDEGTFFLNEINPLPGSLSFYLWRDLGLSMTDILQELIDIAQKRHADKRRSTYTFHSTLLSKQSSGGMKR